MDDEALVKTIAAGPDNRAARLVYADWCEDHGRTATAAALRAETPPTIKRFGVDFDSPGGALTLGPDDIGLGRSGWLVAGEVHEDYYEWVNDFAAAHPDLGVVWGNFESSVYATSEAAYANFYAAHPPEAWDYHDI
jgi:uncharacterized protein (TIGR02996 family)